MSHTDVIDTCMFVSSGIVYNATFMIVIKMAKQDLDRQDFRLGGISLANVKTWTAFL